MARNSNTARTDNYELITQAVVDALQAVVNGTTTRLPWQRDWRTLGVPRNGFSGRAYSGVNVILTTMQPFSDPRWATSNQIMQHCGFERRSGKGARWAYTGEGEAPTERILNGTPTTIIFWKFIKTEVKDAQGQVERNADGSPKTKTVPLLRTFRVYNFEQVNWPAGREPVALEAEELAVDPAEVYADAEAVFAAYIQAQGLPVEHKGDRAYYSVTEDKVVLPKAKRFLSAAGYQRTKAHELVHSTGAAGRLNRNLRNVFGTPDYAREELVAELGAAFLCADLGVNNETDLDDTHKAYLLSWIKRLQDNKYEIFTAARLAREAVALIKGQAAAEEVEDETDEVEEAA